MNYRYQGATKNEPMPETCGDKRGTVTGYNRHRRANESPCLMCRRARNRWQKQWRERTNAAGTSMKQSDRVRSRALHALARERPDDYRRLLDQEWAAEADREAKGA